MTMQLRNLHTCISRLSHTLYRLSVSALLVRITHAQLQPQPQLLQVSFHLHSSDIPLPFAAVAAQYQIEPHAADSPVAACARPRVSWYLNPVLQRTDYDGTGDISGDDA
jgi:hypothetical protein